MSDLTYFFKQIGKHKPAQVEAFHAKNFTANRAALVGIGIDHSKLVKYADLFKLQKGSSKRQRQFYFCRNDHIELVFWTLTICSESRFIYSIILLILGSDAGSKYFGGEIRHENGGRQAVVLLAAETSGLANPREAVACRLLQKILGKKLMWANNGHFRDWCTLVKILL